MKKFISYSELYNSVQLYRRYLVTETTTYFPAKLYFIINKNFQELFKYSEIIEQTKNNLIKQYATLEEDNSYSFSEENQNKAQLEMDELSATIAEIDIIMIDIKDLSDIKLTPAQFQALEFMINIDTLEEGEL